ncbi:MAG: hypothetical protein WCO02_06405 [Bacteroidota bacterium]
MLLKTNYTKKKIFIAFLSLILPYCLHAQSQEDDVVYLNNGTFLRGKIIELVPDHSLWICLSGKDTLCVDLVDVKVIRKENHLPVSIIISSPDAKESGYTFMCELNFGLGLLEGIDRYKDPPQSQYSVMLSVFNGFRFSPIILLGLGTGLEVWNNRIFLPFYIDFRANFLRTENSPFIYLNTGYSIGWKSGDYGLGLGGAMAGLGVGAKFRVSSKNLMTIALGYHFQQTRQHDVNNSVTTKSTLDAHLMNLKVGLVF